MTLPAPLIEKHDGFLVLRDDLIAGGTKRRVLETLLQDSPADEFVYPSTAYGYGPIALAYAGKNLGKKVTLFYAARNRENWTPLMEEAAAQGAQIIPVPLGYMNVVVKRAQDYAAVRPQSLLLPLGFNTDDFKKDLVGLIRSLPVRPKEVWCATGSGVLTRSLQEAWPDAEHHAVIVARQDADSGQAIRHTVQYKFDQAAKNLPPFPSAPNYDAKAWEVMQENAKPGALFWNVGA